MADRYLHGSTEITGDLAITNSDISSDSSVRLGAGACVISGNQNSGAATITGATGLNINTTTPEGNVKIENITVPNGTTGQTFATREWVSEHSGSLEEITTENFMTAVNSSSLNPGKVYRITDYKPTWYGENYIMAGNQFDILILATSSNTYNKEIKFINHAGDTYFTNCDLAKWRGWLNTIDTSTYNEYFVTYRESSMLYGAYLYYDNRTVQISGATYYVYKRNGDNDHIPNPLYCRDSVLTSSSVLYSSGFNPPTVFSQLVKFNHEYLNVRSVKRGIIIDRMIDEFDNDCPYDFKNVVYLGAGNVPAGSGNTGPAGYTFANTTTFMNWVDDTVVPFDSNNRTKGNKLTWKESIMHLPINLFGHCTQYNIIGPKSYINFIGDFGSNNKFGDAVYNIILAYKCKYNTIGNSCYNILLRNNNSDSDNICYNIIGNSCHDITVDYNDRPGFTNNIIHDHVYSLTLQPTYASGTEYHIQHNVFNSGINNQTIELRTFNNNYDIEYHAVGYKQIILD